MQHIIWKPISFCAAIIMGKTSRKRAVVEPKKSSLLLKQATEKRLREALEKASVDGYLGKSEDLEDEERNDESVSVLFQRSRSLARLQAQKEFVKATSQFAEIVYHSEGSIPEFDEAYDKFKRIYPKYTGSCKVDELRYDEYCHLEECFNPEKKVCLDYCGFGLFSYLQQFQSWESSSFGLSEISVNLCNHALYGAPDRGTVEHDIRRRIMEYLNIQENEYSMILTVSRGSAFKLLAESYPFQQNKRLLTMYDHESESVNWLIQGARAKGAKAVNASFRWPTLRLCSSDLRKYIVKKRKRRKDSAVGLFAFPVQSRVTGAKYSYQWMSIAQQNNWHVLLDAGSLGPKDMDSLGLSLFRPDFIITSFYKVFGLDPTGFGCLFIKRTMMSKLALKEGAAVSGMVKIVPVFLNYLGDSIDFDGMIEEEEEEERSECENEEEKEEVGSVPPFVVPDGLGHRGSNLPAFSGAFSNCQVKDLMVLENGNQNNSASERDGASTIFEEIESISGREVMRSPVFSEEDTDHSYCIDLGQSPVPLDNSLSFNRLRLGSSLKQHLNVTDSRDSENCRDSVNSVKEGQNHGKVVDSGGVAIMSFDAAVLSVSQELNGSKSALKKEMGSNIHVTEEKSRALEKQSISNGNGSQAANSINGSCSIPEKIKETVTDDHTKAEIAEVNGSVIAKVACAEANGDNAGLYPSKQISTQKISEIATVCEHGQYQNGALIKESAIRRETEGDFRLLGGRRGPGLQRLRWSGVVDDDIISNIARRVSTEIENAAAPEPCSLESDSEYESEQDSISEKEGSERSKWSRREPEIFCKHLDHVDMMGLNKTSSRLRYLVNWLVASLLQLQFRGPNGSGIRLVHIYGPKIKYDRAASVAFNLFNSNGTLIDPELVQKLADRNSISLGLGFLSSLRFMENHSGNRETKFTDDAYLCKPIVSGRNDSSRKKAFIRIEVLTVSLSFLSNFEDVYRLWAFIAKFLDPNFLEGEGS